MNTTPLVSVLVFAYKHEPYIRQCIDGIMMQKTSFPFEIVVHDDASPDGTAGIIREYEALYPDIIKPVYQKENQYANGGFLLFEKFMCPIAQGKYLAFCEGDDYWTDPFKLQKQIDFLERHPEYASCFHNALVKVENKDRVVESERIFTSLRTGEYSGNEILSKWIIPFASLVFRKNLTDRFLASDRLAFGDVFLFLNLCCLGKVYCINEAMSVYRVNSGSITVRMYNDEQIYKKIILQFKDMDQRSEYRFTKAMKYQIFTARFNYLMFCIRNKRVLKFIQLFFLLMVTSPVSFVKSIIEKNKTRRQQPK